MLVLVATYIQEKLAYVLVKQVTQLCKRYICFGDTVTIVPDEAFDVVHLDVKV